MDPRLSDLQRASPNPLAPLRLVFVDDDSGFVLLARRILREAGLPPENVATCQDGAEARALLEREGAPPAVILIDQKMPRVGGIELLEWIRSKPGLAGIRTLMLSTSEDPEEVKKARRLGVEGYLVKPLGLGELRTLLTDVLLSCVSPGRQVPGQVESGDAP